MRKIVGQLLLMGTLVFGLYSCKTDDAKVAATDDFGGKKVGYWYEVMSFRDGDQFNFVDYHKSNKELLMGNSAGELLPETLKGVWFMDGNPLSDKTIEFPRVYKSQVGANFMFKVGDQGVYGWTNLEKSHNFNRMIDKFSLEYELEFLACPEDVKKERETMWHQANGSCTKADREYAIITPYVTIAGQRVGIPRGLAFFDIYLRGREQDFLVWERRSKLFKVIDDVVAAVKRDTEQKKWHRYKFTQILDKEGNTLQSYPHFIDSLKIFAKENSMDFDHMLYFRCFEGKSGCDGQSLQQGVDDPKFSGKDGAMNFGAMPFM
jgi:hypothetical protein